MNELELASSKGIIANFNDLCRIIYTLLASFKFNFA